MSFLKSGLKVSDRFIKDTEKIAEQAIKTTLKTNPIHMVFNEIELVGGSIVNIINDPTRAGEIAKEFGLENAKQLHNVAHEYNLLFGKTNELFSRLDTKYNLTEKIYLTALLTGNPEMIIAFEAIRMNLNIAENVSLFIEEVSAGNPKALQTLGLIGVGLSVNKLQKQIKNPTQKAFFRILVQKLQQKDSRKNILEGNMGDIFDIRDMIKVAEAGERGSKTKREVEAGRKKMKKQKEIEKLSGQATKNL